MAPDLTDLIGPKKSSSRVSYCRSFAKIKKTATSRNKERAALLRDVFSFSIDAYAKEQRDGQKWSRIQLFQLVGLG